MTERPLDLARIEVILCDADGNLFDSEPPAFDASATVTNRFLETLEVDRRFTGDALRRATSGKNFRTTAGELAAQFGASPEREDLDRWVEEERDVVTDHLAATLQPDPAVIEPLRTLAERYRLAVVSSSATSRVTACLAASGLDRMLPREVVFSAEDSLAEPRGKPSPDIYLLAARRLGVEPERALAVEDTVPGVRSAVAAGHPTIGNVQFVPPGELSERVDGLLDAGAQAVVSSWAQLVGLLEKTAAGSATVGDPAPSL